MSDQYSQRRCVSQWVYWITLAPQQLIGNRVGHMVILAGVELVYEFLSLIQNVFGNCIFFCPNCIPLSYHHALGADSLDL